MTGTEAVENVIRSPVIKSATAITAAVGANTGTAGNIAEAAATSVATTVGNPDWFWLAVSLPWAQIASMVAAMYTMALLSEWVWKKPLHWVLVRVGVKEPTVKLTATEWAKLHEKDNDG